MFSMSCDHRLWTTVRLHELWMWFLLPWRRAVVQERWSNNIAVSRRLISISTHHPLQSVISSFPLSRRGERITVTTCETSELGEQQRGKQRLSDDKSERSVRMEQTLTYLKIRKPGLKLEWRWCASIHFGADCSTNMSDPPHRSVRGWVSLMFQIELSKTALKAWSNPGVCIQF